MINYFHLVALCCQYCNIINTWTHFLHIWTRVVLQDNRLGSDKAEKLVKAYCSVRRDANEPYC